MKPRRPRRWPALSARLDAAIAVVVGVAAALLLRALVLAFGCGCLLQVRAVSPLAGESIGVIACAYVASAVYASALMLGFVLASSYLKGCPRCAFTGTVGLYGPYLAAAVLYLGPLYISPVWFSTHILVLSVASFVLRLYGDVYAAYLAYTGAERLSTPRLEKFVEAVLAVAFAYLIGRAVWLVAVLLGVSGPTFVACGDAGLTPVTVAEAAVYIGFLVLATKGEYSKA